MANIVDSNYLKWLMANMKQNILQVLNNIHNSIPESCQSSLRNESPTNLLNVVSHSLMELLLLLGAVVVLVLVVDAAVDVVSATLWPSRASSAWVSDASSLLVR